MDLYGNVSDTKALAGMLYGMNPKSVETYPAGATIDFGKGVFVKPDGTIEHELSSEGGFVGVAIRHQCESGDYKEKDAVGVVSHGTVWVVLLDDVEPKIGEKAYCDKYAGNFSNEESEEKVEVGVFKSVAENGLALVDLY